MKRTRPKRTRGYDTATARVRETLTTPAAAVKPAGASAPLKTTALARSSGVVFLGTIVGRAMNFAAQVLLSNTLGLAAFGAFTLGQSLLSFLSSLSQAGLHQATMRYLAMGRANQQPAVIRGVMRFAAPRVVLASLALGCALALLREPIAAWFFRKPEIAPVLLWVGLVLPFLCVMNWLCFALRGFRAIKAEAVLKDVVHPALFILLCAGTLALSTLSLRATWWAFLFSTALAMLYGAVRTYRLMQATPRARPDHNVSGDMRRFALPIWFNRLFVAIMSQSDRLLIGVFSTVAQVGMYHAAYRLAMFQTMAMTSFVPMFSTAIAEAFARDDRQTIVHYYRMVVRWSLLVTLPVCLTCVLFARELLLLFGREFEAAVPVLMLVTAASFVDAAVGPAGQILQIIGRERAGLVLVMIAAGLAVGVNMILIPQWGAFGAALGTALGIITLNLGRLIVLRRFLGVFPYSRLTLKLLLIGVAAAALAGLASPLGNVIKAAVLFAALAGGKMMWGLEREDREMFRKLKQRILKHS